MAAEFARMFLDRKRTEQGRSNGLETSPAPNPYQRYGLTGERPLESGKFTGNGEDGVLDPTMPTERRVAVNGRPYAVDEGEVVVINAETVKAYGGPENLDRYIQSHRPDSNYQEMGPRSQPPVDPRIMRGAGQAPASMMNDQFFTGGVPSRSMRPYDTQYQILKDIQGGMPRMDGGGYTTDSFPTLAGTDVTSTPGAGTQVTSTPGAGTGIPSTQGAGSNVGTGFGITLPTMNQYENYMRTNTKTLVPPKAPTVTDKAVDPLGMANVIGGLKGNAIAQKYLGSNQKQGIDSSLLQPIFEPPQIKMPAPLPTEYGKAPEVFDPSAYARGNTKQVVNPDLMVKPATAQPPAGQPVLSPSKLDEMILDSYLSRMGGMSESERAAEEQRLMQQGVSPEAIRGQVAVSDVSRRSAMGQAAEQFATGSAQRADTRAVQNRTFEETRRANEQVKLDNMPIQMKNDAGIMSEASWLAKYPNATADDYKVASGQNVTAQSRFQFANDNLNSLINSNASPEKIKEQWDLIKNNPEFAPWVSTIPEPDWEAIQRNSNPDIDYYTDRLIEFGIGKTNDQGVGYSDSATYRNDMRDFVQAVLTSGGKIDQQTGLITFGTNPDGSQKSIDYPWNDPDTWTRYTDFDGKDIPGNVDPNSPEWLAQTVDINGTPVVRSELLAFWNDLEPAQKILIAAGDKTIGDYYGKDGGGAKLPTERGNLDKWFQDNPEADEAFKDFQTMLGVEGSISLTGPDGIEYEVKGGDKNLRWIWTQLVNENGGDYNKPISRDTFPARLYSITPDGTIKKRPVIDYESKLQSAPLVPMAGPDMATSLIYDGAMKITNFETGYEFKTTDPRINGGSETFMVVLGDVAGKNSRTHYYLFDPKQNKFYRATATYPDSNILIDPLDETSDAELIKYVRDNYSQTVNNY